MPGPVGTWAHRPCLDQDSKGKGLLGKAQEWPYYCAFGPSSVTGLG